MLHNNAAFPFEIGVVNGAVEFVGQIDALISDGFAETVSLETHRCPKRQGKVASARASFAGLCKVFEQIEVSSG
jgi:hypothetical protein